MWVLGKTGTGKSTLLTNLIYEDMQAGRGLMVIDPHGDLVEALLALVPIHRLPETIYFNPADTDYPLAFNPLDCTTGLSASLVADLSYRFWIKANNFQGLFESLPHYVATIKLSYTEISLEYIP